MRTYGGRLINTGIRRILNDRQELRDAVVYDVDSINKYCRVKIQGSNTYIKAFYNENWGSTPEWLKPGNAVRISHPGGNRGRVEVVGHGILRPAAIPGGSVEPPDHIPGDYVIAGLGIIETSPPSMSVLVLPGTYRIEGVEYSLGATFMGDSTIIMGRREMKMGSSGGSVTLGAADSTKFRYDILVVGTDGVVDLIAGTLSPSEPTMPEAPPDHILVQWVLVHPGMTTVTSASIGRIYADPIPAVLKVTPAKTVLEWGELSTTINVRVLDQYESIVTYHTYSLIITIEIGNGTISYGGASSGSSLLLQFTGNINITYTRGGTSGDAIPLIHFLEEISGWDARTTIILKPEE